MAKLLLGEVTAYILHVHYGVHGELYIGINIPLIGLSLCLHYLFSNKKDKGFGCQTRTTDILSPEQAADRRVPPADHCDSTSWLENCPNEGII